MRRKSVFWIFVVVFFILWSSNPHRTLAASLWSDATTPDTASFNDTDPYELGVRFESSTDGYITAIRFYKGSSNTGLHYGTLWTNAGVKMADGVFTNETSSGWQQMNLTKPVKITANTTYMASYYTGVGYYAANLNYFTTSYTNAPLTALSTNGVYRAASHLIPNTTSGSKVNFWVDIVFQTSVTAPSTTGSGPILVITSVDNNFTTYLPEILRAEGLNAFATTDISNVDASVLDEYDTVVLGEMSLSSTQADMFTTWVTAGGNLIAMRPDSDLLTLLGLTSDSATLSDAYLLIDDSTSPGEGIVGETIQYHGTADRYTLNGATAVATLYSNASTATTKPAVTLKSVGSNGGQAAAFTYDLAKSVIRTRQGNPSLEAIDSDGDGVIRANDLFYTSNYLDLTKVHIPQADEQQRLLANMILSMNLDKKPLPRFWYLPSMKKAVLLYAIDDHGTGSGTKGAFDSLVSNSAAGCSLSDWACLRGTSWLYTSSGLTNAQAESFYNQGFEFGAHAEGCTACTPYTYNTNLTSDIDSFRAKYTSIPDQTTHRFHAVPWDDWNANVRVGQQQGIRFDMNYYYYPPSWTGNRPGFMTGSGFPMKFAGLDGSVIDVYQQTTDFTNDNYHVNTQTNLNAVVGRAVGSEGYYGIIGTHDDRQDTATLSAYLNVVDSRDISMVSAKQVLTWVDARNNSSFDNFSWSGNKLTFDITASSSATNLYALLPSSSSDETITSLKKDGSAVSYTTETIKGISYVYFPASTGTYEAQYGTVATSTSVPSSTTSSSGQDPNLRSGWSYIIDTGPNFLGFVDFIFGEGEAQKAKIFVSRNAAPIDLALSITRVTSGDLVMALNRNPFPWMQGLNTVGEIFFFQAFSAFNGYSWVEFTRPVTISLPYDPARLHGVSPEALRIAWYDKQSQRWRVLENNTVVDKQNHIVSNTTTTLSYFVVVYRVGQSTGINTIQPRGTKQAERVIPSVTRIPTQTTPIVQKRNKNSGGNGFFGWLQGIFQ